MTAAAADEVAPGRARRRLKVTGTLHAASPIHVGGLSTHPGIDLDLAVDGTGTPTLPGDSLAGALRAWHDSAFGPDAAARLWGPLAARGTQPAASPTMIDDVALPADALTEVRDGIGIDRATGAAATGIKFVRAVLAAGTPLPVDLTIDVTDEQDQSERLLAELATLQQALRARRVRIGAAKTRGLGRVGLVTDLQVHNHLLTSRDGMLAYLRNHHRPILLPEPVDATVATPAIEAELRWRPVGALLVRAAVTGIAADTMPLVGTGPDRMLHLLLPGSSIKGALRSRAERIVRTVLDTSAPTDPYPDVRFRRTLAEHDLVTALFGTAADRQHPCRGAAAPRQGALFIEDCHADRPLAPDLWRELQQAPRSRARDQLAALGLARDDPPPGSAPTAAHAEFADHVAIDRFTGGSAPRRLFTVLEPHGFAWSPMRLRIELRRIDPETQPALLGLLTLVLRSVAAGQVPFGFDTTRGLGDVLVEHVELFGEDLEHSAVAAPWRSGDLDTFVDRFGATLRPAWQTWIDASRGPTP